VIGNVRYSRTSVYSVMVMKHNEQFTSLRLSNQVILVNLNVLNLDPNLVLL
jgi:hypothetical protein